MTSSSRASSIEIGSYQLFERIGEGGSGQVYRAEGPGGAALAIKLCGPAAELEPEAARARFEREIEALRAIEHPGLVGLLDHGVDEELGPYLVTPLVPGKTLRGLIGARALCPEAALLLVLHLAEALSALHAAELVHRDLKPENIIAAPEGALVIVDLGLALRPGQARLTDEGAVVGSVPYMSPEQIEGREIGAPSDIWAVGVMAYEWIVGARPFARERPAEEAAAALVGSFTPIAAADRRIGRGAAELVTACLDRAPGARPSATELAERIRALIDWAELDALGTELAVFASSPDGYADRVAGVRVRALKRSAIEKIEAGETFAALAEIDRALAYAPEDRELSELAERAERSGAKEPAKPERRPSRWPFVAVAGAAIAIAIAVSVALLPATDENATTSAPAKASGQTSIKDEAVLDMAGGMLSLFDRTIAIEEEKYGLAPGERPRARDPEASKGEQVLGVLGGMIDVAKRAREVDESEKELAGPKLERIPRSWLKNNDDADPSRLRAAPGEALFPADHLGGADPAELLRELEEELAKAPENRELRVHHAAALLLSGEAEQGLSALEVLVRDEPNYALGWATLGYVSVRLGDFESGEEALDRALALDPKKASTRRNRGILRSRLGRTRDAHDDLARAREIEPTDLATLGELAIIYERANRPSDARRLREHIQFLEERGVSRVSSFPE